MSKEEMQTILLEHLTKFRSWTWAQLAERVQRDKQRHDCLENIEGVTADGTTYFIEFQALWDDKPNGDIRVIGDLSVYPKKRLLGFIPVYTPDAIEAFIITPDGRFIGET